MNKKSRIFWIRFPNQIRSSVCRAWATVLRQNWPQPLGQTAKTVITASRPQRKSQNSPAACRLSEEAENGERSLCVTPASRHSEEHSTTGHFPVSTTLSGQGLITIITKRETNAMVPSCETSLKNGLKSFLLSGRRELLTMKRCIFKTSKQEMSLGRWLYNPRFLKAF